MRQLLIILALLLFNLFVNGQQSIIDSLVMQGVEYHDQGELEKAIEIYNKALVLNPNSSVANYEISYTYLALQDYENAVKYSKKVIDEKNGHELNAYMVYGTALDMQGKTKKSVKVYEAALKDYDHYLLYYNHAISCFNLGELDKAYESSIKAILNNPSHASSHLLLSNIMERQGSRIKSILPLYFFLLIEPNSSRSNSAYNMSISKLNYGVERTSEKNISVTVPYNKTEDSEFGAAEMMISLAKASNSVEENENKTEMELFTENNESLFKILGELKKDNKGFWWDFYVPFFYDIAINNHIKAYSYYISQSSGKEEIYDWVEQHREELDNFLNWINN